MIPAMPSTRRRCARAMAVTACATLVHGCGTSTAPNRDFTGGKIDHVVIVFQENRSTDNLFHGFPGADIADSGLDSQGNTITLQPQPLANQYDIGHAHAAFTWSYDDGRMDGFDRVPAVCDENGDTSC